MDIKINKGLTQAFLSLQFLLQLPVSDEDTMQKLFDSMSFVAFFNLCFTFLSKPVPTFTHNIHFSFSVWNSHKVPLYPMTQISLGVCPLWNLVSRGLWWTGDVDVMFCKTTSAWLIKLHKQLYCFMLVQRINSGSK